MIHNFSNDTKKLADGTQLSTSTYNIYRLQGDKWFEFDVYCKMLYSSDFVLVKTIEYQEINKRVLREARSNEQVHVELSMSEFDNNLLKITQVRLVEI